MNILQSLHKPKSILLSLGKSGLLNWLDDKKYIEIVFRSTFHKRLDLNNPQTYNEKLQWLKLHMQNDLFPTLVDKYDAKEFVASIIGKEHVIPTLGVWDRFEDIQFDKLPEQFVLKCTHDSGGVVIVKNKKTFDYNEAKKRINKSLKRNYYWLGREWPYKELKHRIIAEPYLEDSSNSGELSDFKIHCYSGVPKSIQVISNRFSSTGMRNDYYSPDWERIDLQRGHYAKSVEPMKKPSGLPTLLELASKLSQDMIYVRVDFYIVENNIYFGEMTFFPASGFTPFVPDKYDKLFGEWIEIPLENC